MFSCRFDPLWKKINARLLQRLAVRVVFLGPDSEPDPRLQLAKEKEDVRPMDPAFFAAIKDFLTLAEEKGRQWSQVVKPKADQAMASVWERLWKSPEGKAYQELKTSVDRRKAQVDGACKRAEDGIAQKILSGGRVVTFIKTHVVVGREDMVERARQDIERLKQELAEAKGRLRQLEKGKDDVLERLNLLIVEQLKEPGKPKAGGVQSLTWSRRAGTGEIQEAIVMSVEIDDMIADEMAAADGVLEQFVAVLEGLASEEITEEELAAMIPEDEGAPAEVAV